MQIIVKQSYNHINHALPPNKDGSPRHIRNKDEYDRAIKEGGFISYEEACERAERNKKGKEYKISREGQEIINEAKKYQEKGGKVNLKERPKLVDKMIKHGVIKDMSQYSKYLPSAYTKTGGYNGK